MDKRSWSAWFRHWLLLGKISSEHSEDSKLLDLEADIWVSMPWMAELIYDVKCGSTLSVCRRQVKFCKSKPEKKTKWRIYSRLGLWGWAAEYLTISINLTTESNLWYLCLENTSCNTGSVSYATNSQPNLDQSWSREYTSLCSLCSDVLKERVSPSILHRSIRGVFTC